MEARDNPESYGSHPACESLIESVCGRSSGHARMRLIDTLKLVVWEVFNPLVLRAKKGKRYPFNGANLGLNLGCGMDNPRKWLGVDGGVYVLLQKAPTPVLKLVSKFMSTRKTYSRGEYIQKIRNANVLHHELDYGIPFDDDTIPAIFSSH